MKIMTIVGTRPEIIKLSRVISELDRHDDHILIHTGQNYDYELNEVFFQQLGIRSPDFFLGAAEATAAQTISRVIERSDAVLRRERPEAVLLYGDTNSCMAVIAAKRLQIPVFHMEAGNRCFDQRVPEELNRKVIDHLSDINLTLTEHARRYLIAEGIRPETVFKVGSSMPEILAYHRAQIDTCEVLVRLGLERRRFLVVSAHREENVDDPACLAALMESVNAFPDCFDGRTVIFSVHPRTRKRLERDRLVVDPRVQLLKPLGFIDYIALQQAAFCVVSDSGTLTEEASLLGFPGVMIRNAHERPEGMDEGTVVMCGLQRERVHEAVTLVTRQVAEGRGCMRPVADYQAENVSAKIVRIIHSYVDYVNRTVWGK